MKKIVEIVAGIFIIALTSLALTTINGMRTATKKDIKDLKTEIELLKQNQDTIKIELDTIKKNLDTLKQGQNIIYKTMQENQEKKSIWDLF